MSNWLLDFGLDLLGLDASDKATVENVGIPIADALLTHYNANQAVFNKLIADGQALAPIISDMVSIYMANQALFATIIADVQELAPVAQILANALAQKGLAKYLDDFAVNVDANA